MSFLTSLWHFTALTRCPDLSDHFIVLSNPPGSCVVDGKSAIDLTASLGAAINPIPVSAEISNDLKSAKIISVSGEKFNWDIVYKGPYKQLISGLGAANPIYQEISQEERYATIALLKVQNYQAIIDVSSGNVASLKAKYSGPLGDTVAGDVGGDLSVSWTSDDKMQLNISGGVYIAGVLRKFEAGQLQASTTDDDLFGPSPNDNGIVTEIVQKY